MTEKKNTLATFINWMDTEHNKMKLINEVTAVINMSVLYQAEYQEHVLRGIKTMLCFTETDISLVILKSIVYAV